MEQHFADTGEEEEQMDIKVGGVNSTDSHATTALPSMPLAYDMG